MTRRYPAYRDSGVEWLGEVPSNWTLRPLWALFGRTKRTGFADEELLSVYRDYGVIPKSSRDDNFNKPSDDLAAYQLVEVGDLAINKMKAWQGSVAVSEYRGIVSPAYFIFSPRHAEASRYLHYLLRSDEYTSAYMAISSGVRPNQWDLDPQLHSRLPVLLPPLPEQTAIAAFLDRETAKIDALVAEQRRLIDLLKEKRQAVISHAVTRGLNPAAKLIPSGVDWLGDVPEGWTVDRFGRLVAISEGQVDPTVEPYASMILIAPNHVESGTGRLSSLETAAEQGAESGKYMFERGAVIYSKIRPGLAKVAVAPVAGLCSADMYPLTSRGKLRQDYLAWLLLSPGFTAWAALESDRVAMPKINREKLNELRLPVPSLVEQEAIVDFIVKQTASFDQLSEHAEAAISLLQERRAALISAAVTGKIDVRDLVPQETEAA